MRKNAFLFIIMLSLMLMLASCGEAQKEAEVSAIREAALAAEGRAIHMPNKAKKR